MKTNDKEPGHDAVDNDRRNDEDAAAKIQPPGRGDDKILWVPADDARREFLEEAQHEKTSSLLAEVTGGIDDRNPPGDETPASVVEVHDDRPPGPTP